MYVCMSVCLCAWVCGCVKKRKEKKGVEKRKKVRRLVNAKRDFKV